MPEWRIEYHRECEGVIYFINFRVISKLPPANAAANCFVSDFMKPHAICDADGSMTFRFRYEQEAAFASRNKLQSKAKKRKGSFSSIKFSWLRDTHFFEATAGFYHDGLLAQ